MANFNITQSAADRISNFSSTSDQNSAFLRISVTGGGCQGFQYDLGLDSQAGEGDHIYNQGNARVVIDDVSMAFLDGATLIWKSDLTGESFQIQNPNATSSCGCGTSFSA